LRWGAAAVGIAVLVTTGFYWFQNENDRDRCVTDAEEAVSAYLDSHPHPTLGTFRRLEGNGYEGPSFGSPAGYYLQAVRIAHFSNGAEPIRIIVGKSKTAEVHFSVQGQPSELKELEDLKHKDKTQFRHFFVGHPRLREPVW
jgi:hypothetical protein